jgi:hypothetical protein
MDRQKCKYPMSEFYIFEDEVPKGSRASTVEDCEACDETECDLRHCLIQEINMIGKLKNVRGDATVPQTTAPNEIVVIPHCCNDGGGWGKGFVLALSNKWHTPERMYRDFCDRNFGFPILGKVCAVKVNDKLAVMNMIGQQGTVTKDNPKPVKYRHLANAMAEVAAKIDFIQSRRGDNVVIHCPKFGSDLAGGNWDFILELIREIWLEAGIDVVVYEWEADKDKWGVISD